MRCGHIVSIIININSNLSGSLIYSIDIEILNNDVGQGLAPAEKIHENTAGASPCPTIICVSPIIVPRSLSVRKNRSQCCLSKRRRTSVLRACAGSAVGNFNHREINWNLFY